MRDIAEFRSVCGRTLAVVLAADEGALAKVESPRSGEQEAAVCAAVDNACWAQAAFVFVLATPALGEEVTREVHLAKRRKNAPLVQAVECEENALRATRDARDWSVLQALMDAAPVDCDAALVIDASQEAVSPDDIFALCRAADGESNELVNLGQDGSCPYVATGEFIQQQD